MKFRAVGIEGLRGLAALAVVISHTASFLQDPSSTGGSESAGMKLVSVFAGLGVHGLTVFFVISGFLLYRPFVMQMSRGEQTLIVREYMRNRILRIFPAYLVIFTIAAFGLGAVVTKVASDTNGDYVGRMTDPVLIITNYTLTQSYLPQGQLTGLGASWSLVPEVAFYVLLPLFWLIGRRLARRSSWVKAVLTPVLVMMVIGLVLRFAIAATMVAGGHGDDPINASTWRAVVWHTILTQGDLFAMGMVVAVFSVYVSELREDRHREREISRITRYAWWALIFGVVVALPAKVFFVDAAAIGLVAAAFIWIVIYGNGRPTRAARAVLEWAPVDRAGVISYSTYLWHVPVIFMLRTHFPGLRYDSVGSYLVDLVLVYAITWILSEITFRLVEDPALSHKRSMIRRDERQVQSV